MYRFCQIIAKIKFSPYFNQFARQRTIRKITNCFYLDEHFTRMRFHCTWKTNKSFGIGCGKVSNTGTKTLVNTLHSLFCEKDGAVPNAKMYAAIQHNNSCIHEFEELWYFLWPDRIKAWGPWVRVRGGNWIF